MIAFDTSADIGNVNPAGSLTVSYTVGSGANRLLIIHVLDTTNVGITSVTYNGVAMTDIGTTATIPGTSQTLHTFYLVNPASGAHNVTVTMNSSTGFGVLAQSYANVLQTSPIDVSGAATVNPAASISKTITTTVNNDWTIAVASFAGSGPETAGSSTTRRNTEALFFMASFDSNADLAVGNNTLNVNNGGSSQGAMLMTSIKPVPPAGGFFAAAS